MKASGGIEPCMNPEQSAGEAGIGRGDHEGEELIGVDV